MSRPIAFKCFNTGPETVRLAVVMSVRFLISLPNMEDMLHERGIDASSESIRF